MPSYRRSIRSQIRIWVLGLTLGAIFFSLLFLRQYANDELSHHLALTENLIQLYADDSIAIEYGRNNPVYVEDSLRRLVEVIQGKGARVRDQSGVVANSTNPNEIGAALVGTSKGDRLIKLAIREHSSREEIGTLEVVLDDQALVLAAFQKALLPAFLLLLGLSILAAFVIRSLQHRLIKPIQQLSGALSKPDRESSDWPSEIHDLSKRLDDALKQRDLAMIGQFASGIVHDLKTSLHTMQTALELTQDSEPGTERRTQCLDLLLKSASHHVPKMNALVATTLDGTRSIAIDPVNASVHATLKRSIDSNVEMLKRHKVRLHFDDSNADLIIKHDPVQIERVFSNVIRNAIEATSESSSLSEKQILISVAKKEAEAVVTIEDSGAGLRISADELLKSVKTTKVHGAGLGLWVSRKIIEAHQGKISAGRSDQLSGARFEIRLPHSVEVQA